VSPKDGAKVSGPVTVVFGLKGMGIAPAGIKFDNTGHHHLLVEALLTLGARSTEGFGRRPPQGRTPAERLSAVFRRILRDVAAKPLLHQAVYRAYVASAPALTAHDGLIGFGPERAQWIGDALRAGDTDGHGDDALDAAARILSTLFLGAVVGVAAGKDVEEATSVLVEATHRLLP